jgi:hypothetical protein
VAQRKKKSVCYEDFHLHVSFVMCFYKLQVLCHHNFIVIQQLQDIVFLDVIVRSLVESYEPFEETSFIHV